MENSIVELAQLYADERVKNSILESKLNNAKREIDLLSEEIESLKGEIVDILADARASVILSYSKDDIYASDDSEAKARLIKRIWGEKYENNRP